MRLYLDANVLLGLLVEDPLSGRADELLARQSWTIVLSDFAQAEFASAVARHVRTERLTRAEAVGALQRLDAWAGDGPLQATMGSADLRTAIRTLRRLDLPLRTPDALHIAMARRLDATLATFDQQMATAAEALGLTVAS